MYGGDQRLLVSSDTLYSELLERGWPEEQLVAWAPGVNGDQFSPARRCERLRAQWGVSDHRLAILYAGSLSAERGLHLFRAVQHVLGAHGVPHRFVLAGDGPMAERLREMLPDAVFTGRVPHAAMGRVVASADLLLFPGTMNTATNIIL